MRKVRSWSVCASELICHRLQSHCLPTFLGCLLSPFHLFDRIPLAGKASTFDSFVKEAGATYNQVDARRKLEEAERSGALAEYNIERDATYIGPALVAKKAWDSLQEISAAVSRMFLCYRTLLFTDRRGWDSRD